MVRITMTAASLWVVASFAAAQTFEISSQSGFVYFPSPLGSGIPGCQANDFRCDFGITGTLNISADLTSLSFLSANLTLSGNQSIQDNPPFADALVTGAAVSNVLVSEIGTIPLVSDIGGVQTYGATGFDFEATITGDELRVIGGRDSTPVDGDAYTFDMATTIVPEPGPIYFLGWCLAAAFSVTRRTSTAFHLK